MALKPYKPFLERLAFPSETDPEKVYEIAPVGITDGKRLALALDPASGTELTNDEFEQILLGDARTQMAADNVSPEYLTRCLLTALADVQSGRAVAEIMWDEGTDPKAVAAWIEARDSKPSPPTVAARTTKRRARSSTTTNSPAS